jgi:histone chaperone ASF1
MVVWHCVRGLIFYKADAPDPQRIPPSELLGVTVVLLTCAYKGKEFVRVGYYVNVEYADEELRTNPPAQPIIEKLYRSVLAEKPKVTRYPIQWDLQESTSGSGMETEPTLSMV